MHTHIVLTEREKNPMLDATDMTFLRNEIVFCSVGTICG